jgi:hypothetical protein
MQHQDHFVALKREVLEIQDRRPQLSPDNAFVAWYLRAFIVDDEASAVESLKGGSRDKGLDAIYVDHENQIVFLIQGKYRQGPTPVPENRADVLALADTGRILCSSDDKPYASLTKGAEETVKTALNKCRLLVNKRRYRLRLHFVTTGKVARGLEEEAIERVYECGDRTDLEIHTRTQLLRRMQDYIEGVAPAVPVIHLPIHKNQSFRRHDEDTGITSWIFSMQGSDLGRLCKDIGDRLFARNIRGYLGQATSVNRGMEHTLKKEPQHFWYFNNGVTIVCDAAKEITERNQQHLRIANAQIINGQQTTRTLARYTDSGATILVKVIVVPRDDDGSHDKYSHLISEIVSATNWQNAISQTDLKSNDPEQVRLDRDFQKLGYQYLRKRMTKAEARRLSGSRYKMQIKKEELAQCVAACVLDPAEVRLGKERLFEDDLYETVFNGRSASDCLVFVRLHSFVRYCCRGDIRKGRAKWLVLNYLWSRIGPAIHKRSGLRDQFLHVASRESRYSSGLSPLYSAIGRMFTAAMAFYSENKRTNAGILDESSFFRHRNLHKTFADFLNSRSNVSRATAINRSLAKVKHFLRSVESEL